MAKKIVINNCGDCPHINYGGGFGKISYLPSCVADEARDLPYKTVSRKSVLQARITDVIPVWCMLMDDKIQKSIKSVESSGDDSVVN